MKALFLTVALFLALPLTAMAHDHHTRPDGHLVFSEGAVHAHLYWEQGPQVGKESILRIEFRKGADHTATEITENVEVVLWMPDMGHGSAPTSLQRVLGANGEAQPGVYRVSNVYFVMGGKWDVRLILRHADDSEEQQVLPVVLEGDSGHGHH